MPTRISAHALAALFTLVAVLVPGPAPAGSGSPGEENSQWWAVEQAATSKPLTRAAPTASTTVRIPESGQHQKLWYVTRVGARIDFEAGGVDRGNGRLVAYANGKAVALITLRAQKDGVRIFYDGVLTGPKVTVTEASHAVVQYTNYVVDDSARSGPNTVKFALEDRGRLVKQVTIHQDSALGRTTIPPEQLSIHSPATVTAAPGERFKVPYSVRSRREREDRPLTVRAQKTDGRLELVSSEHRYNATGHGVKGHFVASAKEPGQYELLLAASGGYNEPTSTVLLTVKASGWRYPSGIQILAALLLVAFAFLILPTTRRARSFRRRARRRH
ncbi:hypothetical protein ACTMTJ_44880 [Phytohabitans sp. LJ34]|uniref:hypothetical protein n=1 Tax=Phytohabitans sp. LJ34 TaxID=3452217 RepID=UPI003F89E0B8